MNRLKCGFEKEKEEYFVPGQLHNERKYIVTCLSSETYRFQPVKRLTLNEMLRMSA